MVDVLEKFIDLLAVRTANRDQAFLKSFGHFVRWYNGTGHIGGVLTNVETDEQGRVYVSSLTLSSIMGCGHTVTSVDQICGVCMVCKRLCCLRPGCLLVCDITGITVCKRHYSVKDGIVVSSPAKKGLWRLRAKRLARIRRESRGNGTKKIPEKI
jgi:hypothetical protein